MKYKIFYFGNIKIIVQIIVYKYFGRFCCDGNWDYFVIEQLLDRFFKEFCFWYWELLEYYQYIDEYKFMFKVYRQWFVSLYFSFDIVIVFILGRCNKLFFF